MIERHWVALTRPEVAVVHVTNRLSLRKRLLIGCGYGRLGWTGLPTSLRQTIAAVESKADGDGRAAESFPRPRATADAIIQSQLIQGDFGPGDFSQLVELNRRYGVPLPIELLRCIVGNPYRPVTFDPAWRSSAAVGLAEAIYAGRAFDRLPVLADALEEAGCGHPDVLAHCRGDGPHARGCWVVDLVLGKA